MEALLAFDRTKAESLSGFVAGVDEAGRGPLAGPVVAACVILHKPTRISFLDDSKKLTPKKRQKIYIEICKHALVGIGVADVPVIDTLNIFQATRCAMKRAVLNLSRSPDHLLVDGPIKLDLPLSQEGIVRGDQKSASIAAASIVAKVYRDQMMEKLHAIYPSYAFHQNKGYPTKKHLQALESCGPSPIHRKTFGPVKESLLSGGNRS